MSEMLSPEQAREALDYDPETGVFTWKIDPPRGKKTLGKIAGNTNASGYRRIHFQQRWFLAHRLAWLYVHGIWPHEHIDHIDGDRDNNRISNLRPANNQQNHENRRRPTRTNPGPLGTSFEKRSGKWRADIATRGKRRTIGYFNTSEEAHQAYLAAKRVEHSFNTL